jgi:hypothetical protein
MEQQVASKPTYDELVEALEAAAYGLHELSEIIEKRRRMWLWRNDIPVNEQFYRRMEKVTSTLHRVRMKDQIDELDT